jgi:UDP-N-acetylglucosamine diphosphorylase / glucose-1-phosphate thymidylyltransferase / UDP-N-acetylgalactosamine diphosphorylase / glucosamine-1-phosphate N-acetyltransferase / galactosamine-1-phosphate N-acetyltransferase
VIFLSRLRRDFFAIQHCFLSLEATEYYFETGSFEEPVYLHPNFQMGYVLFDTEERRKLYPLTYTRAVADLRIGILTMKEWWEKLLQQEVYVKTADYLQPLYSPVPAGDHIYINASVIPATELVGKVQALQPGEVIRNEKGTIAFHTSEGGREIQISGLKQVTYPWHIFQLNDEVLRTQFTLFAKQKFGVQTAESTHVINASELYIEDGCVIEHAVLNASTGPIYIGKNVTIMEGSFIRGPFAIGEGSVVKMGTKIYGATTAGPYSVLGGEIRNSVLQGYSNKAHEGYLGHSVIGEWCNLGAGTSNSNLKNTAGEICMNDFEKKNQEMVGNKCGVIMGDYTRTAINSSINTGSIFGVCCNVFGEYLLPKSLPNFSWGVTERPNYDLQKAIRDIRNWKELKEKTLSPAEEKMIAYIFEQF